MKNTRSVLLAASTVLVGAVACLGWLSFGHLDDAPGAGMIGFAILLVSFFVAYRIVRGAGIAR